MSGGQGPKVLPAVVVDVVAIVLFAITGRSSHAEANSLTGVLHTAWPFLAAALTAHVVLHLLGTPWRDHMAVRSGLLVWVITVPVGLGLRLLAGDTAAWPFMIVATLVLGLLLVGWRAGFLLIMKAHSTRSTHPV